MYLIVCLDDKNGMLLGGRRQSRDRVVCEKIAKKATSGKLWMNTYSAKLFSQIPAEICIDDAFLEKAGENDFCFVENTDFLPYAEKIKKIVLFKWNRHYPADKFFSLDLNDGLWHLQNSVDFPGFSHERITMEEYMR